MCQIRFTTESVKQFYHDGFGPLLQMYFQIKMPEKVGQTAIILHPSDVKGIPGNPTGEPGGLLRLMTGGCSNPVYRYASVENNFIFSGLVMYMVLIPQAINAICGSDELWDWEMVRDFYLASGWPEFSNGLGGPYASVQSFLRGSSLYPMPAEGANYLRMLDVVAPFMQEEIRRFLSREEPQNLNAGAYARLTGIASGHVDEILKWLEEQTRIFREELMDLAQPN